MKMLSLLKSLRRRKPDAAGSRIGSLEAFVKRLTASVGTKGLAEVCGVTVPELRKQLRGRKSMLTYFDPDHCSPLYFARPQKSGLKYSGKPAKEEDAVTVLSGGSIMDFDCTVTSSRRDRDGDVLDPKGAVIDQKMPLLWQHLPFSPVGRMVKVLDQSDDKITARFMVADTLLGKEVATLIDAGCLRISHGFAPIEYNPLKDDQGKDMGGWRISKYAMMETSVVSIPSNVDAEISAFSRGKGWSPLMKAWGEMLMSDRVKIFTGGVGGKKAAGDDTEDEDEENKEATGDDTEDEDADDGENKGDVDPTPEDEETDPDGDGDDDSSPETDTDDDAGEGDDAEDDTDAEGDTPARALGEIIDAVAALGKMADMPKEASARVGIVSSMFEDVEESIGATADSIVTAAKARDLVGMFNAVSDLTQTCSASLGRAADELARLADVPGLSDDAVSAIQEVTADANNIVQAIGLLSGAADMTDMEGADDEADETADADAEDDDELEVSEADVDEERMADDEDAEDSEEDKEADYDADEDADDKEADDEEQEDKDADTEDAEAEDDKGRDDEDETTDENPESETAGGTNPGIVPPKRSLSELLGLKLAGHPITPEESKRIRKSLGNLADY